LVSGICFMGHAPKDSNRQKVVHSGIRSVVMLIAGMVMRPAIQPGLYHQLVGLLRETIDSPVRCSAVQSISTAPATSWHGGNFPARWPTHSWRELC